MELSFTPEQQAFRAEARRWFKANVPRQPLASMDTAQGFEQHRRWERALYEGGWAAIHWPPEFGGRGASLIDWLIFEEEYWAAGSPPRLNQNGLFLLGTTLLEHGTPEQRRRFLPAMAAGDHIWAQGWSEPNAGSDLASLTSRAIRDGGHWVLTGQKTWASRGAFADWMFGLFRTDPEAERHRGLSFILLPLRDTPGVTVRPIRQLNGETGFAEVFFDGVRVPVENTVGEPGDGWRIAMSTAGFERGVFLRSPGRFLATAARLVGLLREAGPRAPASAMEEVARAWMEAQAYRLHTYQAVSRLQDGQPIGADASMNKVFWSEMDLRMHETALELLASMHREGEGPWSDGFLFAQAGPIYAGTNEIQRNIVAERVLGLPKG